jgi:hypothetical protein
MKETGVCKIASCYFSHDMTKAEESKKVEPKEESKAPRKENKAPQEESKGAGS